MGGGEGGCNLMLERDIFWCCYSESFIYNALVFGFFFLLGTSFLCNEYCDVCLVNWEREKSSSGSEVLRQSCQAVQSVLPWSFLQRGEMNID